MNLNGNTFCIIFNSKEYFIESPAYKFEQLIEINE